MAEAKAEKKEKKVQIIIPYVEGEPESQYVACNGEEVLIMKGEIVEVSPAIAEVLKNANIQAKEARQHRKSIQMQELEA